MFAALDAIAEEVHLHEQVGIGQTLQYRWKECKQAPVQSERRKVLQDVYDWVDICAATTGEQIVASRVDDHGWSEAYPELPETAI